MVDVIVKGGEEGGGKSGQSSCWLAAGHMMVSTYFRYCITKAPNLVRFYVYKSRPTPKHLAGHASVQLPTFYGKHPVMPRVTWFSIDLKSSSAGISVNTSSRG